MASPQNSRSVRPRSPLRSGGPEVPAARSPGAAASPAFLAGAAAAGGPAASRRTSGSEHRGTRRVRYRDPAHGPSRVGRPRDGLVRRGRDLASRRRPSAFLVADHRPRACTCAAQHRGARWRRSAAAPPPAVIAAAPVVQTNTTAAAIAPAAAAIAPVNPPAAAPAQPGAPAVVSFEDLPVAGSPSTSPAAHTAPLKKARPQPTPASHPVAAKAPPADVPVAAAAPAPAPAKAAPSPAPEPAGPVSLDEMIRRAVAADQKKKH